MHNLHTFFWLLYSIAKVLLASSRPLPLSWCFIPNHSRLDFWRGLLTFQVETEVEQIMSSCFKPRIFINLIIHKIELNISEIFEHTSYIDPRCSMYDLFTYIRLNGTYTIVPWGCQKSLRWCHFKGSQPVYVLSNVLVFHAWFFKRRMLGFYPNISDYQCQCLLILILIL